MKTALVVIDVQVGINTGSTGNAGWPAILANIAQLAARARAEKTPVIFIQHDGPPGHRLEPGTPGWALNPALGRTDAEVVIRKEASDSFFDTPLEKVLREQDVGRLVIAGCMTEYCVDTTVRRAVSLGFDVVLAQDGHATWDSPRLSAEQIIAHHNGVLEGFDAGKAVATVVPAAAIQFS